jgi:hypothetical protein
MIMNNSLKNVIFIFSLLGLAIPAHAMTYLDVKFKELVEHSVLLPEKKKILQIDDCLENGANVNLMIGGQTPIMLVVNAIAMKAKLLNEMHFKNDGLWNIMGTFSIPFWLPRARHEHARRVILAIRLGVLSGFVGLCGYLIFDAFRNRFFYEELEAELEILKMFLKHPSIDLTITNGQGKTAYDLIEGHVKAVEMEIHESKAKNYFLLEFLKRVQNILKAKQQELIATKV